MQNLNAALAILLSSGLDLTGYIGIVELKGDSILLESMIIDHATTEYDLDIQIWRGPVGMIIADIDKVGCFQLLQD